MGEVTAVVFRDGELIEHVALDTDSPQQIQSEFVWIEVLDPIDSDLAILQQRFGVHRLVVADSMRPAQIPKVDLYDDQVFVVLKIARLENDVIRYGEIDAILSARRIITVRRGEDFGHAHAVERFRNGTALPLATPDFILHAILDFIVKGYFPIVQMVEEEAFAMEQHLQDAFLDREEITRLFRLRREAIHFQHVLASMSAVCGKLTNLEIPGIGSAARPYFRDVHDHLVRLDVMVNGLVEVVRSVFETSGLLEQQRQGVTTRQLAAWAAILGVPAAIAGIYGVTFPTELQAPYGPAMLGGAMMSICIGLYIRFRKLHWL